MVIAVGHAAKASSALMSDLSLIPWLVIMAVAVLLLGWLTASGCHNMALAAAEREQARAIRDMRDQVAAVARDALGLVEGGGVEAAALGEPRGRQAGPLGQPVERGPDLGVGENALRFLLGHGNPRTDLGIIALFGSFTQIRPV